MHFSASRMTARLDFSISWRLRLPQTIDPDAHGIGQILQFAVAVAFTDLAFARMVVEDQFDQISARLADFRRIGADAHALTDRSGAGRHKVAASVYLDDTDAARAFDGQVRMITKTRNFDPQFFRGCRMVVSCDTLSA
jgi:hypothetical protein